ncbi:DUF3298 and DUF4163 domain-containing protein [Clostridium sp.]|uniref:DUF3298 and DUF4163 domain-containing protein n=1 Tax=Clostridium sp. TaxID=1506 RepID=UPI00260A5DFC|nr:DUF3298 and DUF4163 domain-containing protein [Clostridium sp.]
MKRMLTSIISIFIINVYSSYPQHMLIKEVNQNVESPIVVDKSIKEIKDYIRINGEIPQIIGLSKEKAQAEINNEIVDYTDRWIKENKDASEEFQPTTPYELISSYVVTNNIKILSFYIDYYQFNGGAHGITNRKSYNIDIESAKKLKLQDLFQKNFDYNGYINNIISTKIEQNKDFYFTGKDGFNGIEDNQEFFIRDNKLVIYFDYYKIAPYVSGMPEFEIPLK